MIANKIQNIAFFKLRSTNCIPLRNGPVQCIRNCTHCIKKTNSDSGMTGESEDLISIKSFDNLVERKSLWLSQHQSIQYHVGQIDLLKKSLVGGDVPLTIYIVATTETKDLQFLNMILDHARLPLPNCITSNTDIESILKKNKTIVIPIQLRSCVSDSNLLFKEEPCFTARQLRDLLEPCIKFNLDFNIVPVTITKDHNRLTLFGVGSVGVQISEPYKLSAYLKGIQSTQQMSTHLVQHVYYDAAKSAIILPSHLVAFLLLYLEREDGVKFSELVEYMDWFRKVSGQLDMHLGFTGSSQEAVRLALVVLGDFVQLSSNYYLVRDVESLTDYANLVVPIIAYRGLIGRAILTEYNRDKPLDQQLTSFKIGMRIRVMRDKVIEASKLMADRLEQRIPCRRPCSTIERCIEDTISQMATFDRYLKIEEPLIASTSRARRWAGDSDDDDEDYFQRNQDKPAFKTWLLLSERDYRRDRLNLFINSVELYLF